MVNCSVFLKMLLFETVDWRRVNSVKVELSTEVRSDRLSLAAVSVSAAGPKLRRQKLVPPLPAFNTVRPGKHSHTAGPASSFQPRDDLPSLTIPSSLPHLPPSYSQLSLPLPCTSPFLNPPPNSPLHYPLPLLNPSRPPALLACPQISTQLEKCLCATT